MDNLKDKKFVKFIVKYKYTIIALTLLFVLIKLIAGSYNNKHWLIVLSFFGLLSLLSKVKKYVSVPLTIILAVLLTADSYFPIAYGEKLSFGIIDALAQANAAEVDALFLSVMIQSLVTFAILFIVFLLSQKELKDSRLGWKFSLLIFASYWLVFIPIFSAVAIVGDKDFEYNYKGSPAYTVFNTLGHRFPVFFRSTSLYLAFKEQTEPIRSYSLKERVMPYFVSVDTTNVSPKKVYMILGESGCRNHMSLYGYSVKTTPFLDSLSENNTALKFYNGVSGAPVTNMAIPLAITFALPGQMSLAYDYKNVMEMAKAMGYEVLWISSQGRYGTTDTLTRMFASQSDKMYFNDKWPPNDFDLVDKMKEWLDENKKQFIILHLDGSHFEYKAHYDERDVEAIVGDGMVVDYDRTIHHTDRVLESVYNTIKDDESSVMLYFSDHGEIVGKGHGFLNEGAEQFEIPFVTFNKNYSRIDTIVNSYQSEDGFVSGINVINILNEVVGYTYTDEYRKQAVEDGGSVHHVDNQSYRFDEIKRQRK